MVGEICRDRREIYVREPAREIPVLYDTEVVVVGGGPAGIGAAIAASRNGARTVLVERYGIPGGTGTVGYVNDFWAVDRRVTGGIFAEVLDRLIAEGGVQKIAWGTTFDGEMLKSIALDMLEEAGVTLLLHSLAVDVVMEGNRIRGVIIENVSGRQAVLGKVIIDASGDADIATKAGVPFQIGRDASTDTPDGRTQALTLMFTISGFDTVPDQETRDKINEAAEKAKKEGSLRLTHKGIVGWTLPRPAQYQFNSIHISVNPLRVEDLTYAEIESRKQARSIVNFFKKNVLGFENCFLLSTGVHIGIRDSRRIIGEYVLSWKDDLLPGKTHYDDIAMGNDHEDIHGPGEGHGTLGRQIQVPPYGIPYRCLLPKNVDNLLVAGRCLSADWRAQSSARVMPTCFSMGQAAGTAAALAVKNNATPREVDITALRTLLREQGAIIFDEVPEEIRQSYLSGEVRRKTG